MKSTFVKELQDVLGSGQVRDDEEARRAATVDPNSLPDAVVFPQDGEQVARVVLLAAKEGIPVIPWGAGRHAFRGLLPLRGGIVINLTGLQRVLEFDQDNQTAYVETGLSLAQLKEIFGGGRLFLPLDPVEGEDCTLGGCIASHASGPRKLGYGTIKDYLLGLEVVLPTGEIVRTGGKTVKNVQDYDNTRFLAGSWGALGIITKAMLKLKPLPEKEVTVVLGFSTLGEACEAAYTLRKEWGPVALELLDSRTLEALKNIGSPVAGEGKERLVVAFAGFTEAVDWQVEQVAARFGRKARINVYANSEAQAIWEARRKAFAAFSGDKGGLLGQVSLPFTSTGKFITAVDEFISSKEAKAGIVAHFGNGHVHIFIKHPPLAYSELRDFLTGIEELAVKEGGLFLLDNVWDLKAIREKVENRGPALLPLLKRIKEALDPKGILAPNSKAIAYALSPQG
ncbi:MAG: FAD-binding oxidoreductase [Thermanaeromonas sp.]|uniref:FAD-binding oxidoreductase n=1 Tax=Thermanaeromonas sp. TaxID=2003697 RepID=UPI002438A8F9|nr:FAD-binding oxidoreductase [Thermanaeromonas sp.]MCG0277360.1 FAD-binding oxidoreductase [Thermanaeromonas sp.]